MSSPISGGILTVRSRAKSIRRFTSAARAEFVGVDCLQGTGMGQGPGRLARQPLDQGPQDAHPQQLDVVGLGQAPGLELVTTRQCQFSGKPPLSVSAAFSSSAQSDRWPLQKLADLPQVEGDRLPTERDLLAIGGQHLLSVDIHDPA